LERNLEYHLLGNHILKNAKALVFGGAFFAGAQAERLLRKGVHLMVDETREQFLPDGGHFERSPMYHCIALEDLLDVISLASACPDLINAEAMRTLVDAAGRALQFLDDLRCGDGEIPLFNDAAFGITAPAAALLAHGRAVLGLRAGQEDTRQGLRICKPDTGYFGYRKGEDSFIIDCGPVGPDYQPGHAHCDTLSYELCLDGRRVVVDSGVHDYENGALRHRLRGTAAHNTVSVDGAEQSEIWGAFRVARRARPLYADLGPWQGSRLEFRGAHDGYRRLPGRVTHERFVTMDAGGAWEITDNLSGSGQHRVESYINFHPRCSVKPLGPKEFRLDYDGAPVARLAVKNECRIQLVSGLYCPEFGLKQETATMMLCSNGSLPIRLGYAIERA
jgi:uncharacterized heparinase superfamily protein